MTVTPWRSLSEFQKRMRRVRRMLGRLTTATLILHPREDDGARPANAVEIRRRSFVRLLGAGAGDRLFPWR